MMTDHFYMSTCAISKLTLRSIKRLSCCGPFPELTAEKCLFASMKKCDANDYHLSAIFLISCSTERLGEPLEVQAL
jgi:hypothetical protein